MSVKNIKHLHLALTKLFRVYPILARTDVSLLTDIGEVLSIQLDGTLIVQYAQNRVPEITLQGQIFWRYGNDAFVDATMAMPDYVWVDVMTEASKYKDEGEFIEAEEIKKELE